MGTSWWVEILPQLDETALAARLDATGPYAGWVVMHPQNARLVNNVAIGVMFCPSSPLPQFGSAGSARVGLPSYVGVSGATNAADFHENRVSKCDIDGEISAGGMLIPNAAIRRGDITDGTSHALAVAEASDYCFDMNGNPVRVDGGTSNGWLAGTFAVGTPPTYDSTLSRPSYNITTVRYPVGTRDYELPGIRQVHGANNPILSAHPGGAIGLFADGSVRFLADSTEILTLKRLATRDDREIASVD
jgi:prepilin-type processing-associated H-X9-DG protein